MSLNEPLPSGGIVPPSIINEPLCHNMSLPELVSYALSLNPESVLLIALRDKLQDYVPRVDKLRDIETSLMDIEHDLQTALREIREIKNGTQ